MKGKQTVENIDGSKMTSYLSDKGFYKIDRDKGKKLPIKSWNDFDKLDSKDLECDEDLFSLWRRGGKFLGSFDTLVEAQDEADFDYAERLHWDETDDRWTAEDYSIVKYKTVYVLYCKDVIIDYHSLEKGLECLTYRADGHRKMTGEVLKAMRKRGSRKQ